MLRTGTWACSPTLRPAAHIEPQSVGITECMCLKRSEYESLVLRDCTLTLAQKVGFLQTTVFDSMKKVHVTKLACLLREHQVVKGEVIFSEGQPVHGACGASS